MRTEQLEWGEEMREARLWLTDKDGRIIMAWGWCDDASHLCALGALEEMLGGKREATILVVNEDDDDTEMRELWTDANVDLIIVEEFAGIFRPAISGARREHLSGFVVEATPQTWWVTDARNDVTTVAVDWSDAVRAMIGIM